VLALASCDTASSTDDDSVDQPNIILVIVDDQGYADFTPFGQMGLADTRDSSSEMDGAEPSVSQKKSQGVHSPNIKALGDAGRVYTQAYVTAPVCSPSRVGMLTGKYQFRWDKPASWGPGLPDDVKTMAEYLREAGYATAKVGKNDLGRNFHKHDVREYPLRHGFDEFLGFSAHAHDYWHHSAEIRDRTPDPYATSALLGPLLHDEGELSIEEGYMTDIITDASIEYIKEERDQPFFLMVSYSALHHLIHQVPEKYLQMYDVEPILNYEPDSLMAYGKWDAGTYSAYYDKYSRVEAIKPADLRKYYLANLHCLDDNVGRVLGAVKEEGIEKETIIIFISDNGGSPLTGADNSPLTGGKYSLWEGGIRVPMSITWPGHIEPEIEADRYVSATDLLPTIANVTGLTLDDSPIDGQDLLADAQEDRVLVWKWQKTWAVRQGKWKLTNAHENHWKSEPSDQYIAPVRDDRTLKLFDLEADPGERIDLAENYPEVVAQLEQAHQGWWDAKGE